MGREGKGPVHQGSPLASHGEASFGYSTPSRLTLSRSGPVRP